MAYTNSSMVVYTKLSPNHSGQRTMAIDRITPHCVVGQCTAEGLGDWFMNTGIQASSNYGIDKDGRVALYVEEKNRSWCSSSNANDQRAISWVGKAEERCGMDFARFCEGGIRRRQLMEITLCPLPLFFIFCFVSDYPGQH